MTKNKPIKRSSLTLKKSAKSQKKKPCARKKRSLKSLFFCVAFIGLAFVAYKKRYNRFAMVLATIAAANLGVYVFDLDMAEAFIQTSSLVVFIATALSTVAFSAINLINPSWAATIANYINLK